MRLKLSVVLLLAASAVTGRAAQKVIHSPLGK